MFLRSRPQGTRESVRPGSETTDSDHMSLSVGAIHRPAGRSQECGAGPLHPGEVHGAVSAELLPHYPPVPAAAGREASGDADLRAGPRHPCVRWWDPQPCPAPSALCSRLPELGAQEPLPCLLLPTPSLILASWCGDGGRGRIHPAGALMSPSLGGLWARQCVKIPDPGSILSTLQTPQCTPRRWSSTRMSTVSLAPCLGTWAWVCAWCGA